MECKCIFCIVPPCSNSGRDTLPVPILVVDSSCTFWAWLTSVVPLRLLLTTKRQSPPLTFDSFESAVLFVGKGKKRKNKGRSEEKLEEEERSSRSLSKTDQIHIFVKTTEGLCDFAKFAGFRGEGGTTNSCATSSGSAKGRNAPPLELMGDSCMCTRPLPRKLFVSNIRNEQEAKRRKKKNEEQMDNDDLENCVESIQVENKTTPRRSLHTTSNHLESQSTFDSFQSTFDHLQSKSTFDSLLPSSSSSFPSVRLKMHYPTDETIARLGGCPDKVRYIVESRDVWDEEVVEELIRWGARPELHSVGETVQRRWFTSVECTFVQPDGRLVPHVWLSLDYLKQDYPAHVAHLD